jgi:mono/diheme cytochrome c family protein
VVVKASWRLILPGEEDFKARCFWITAQLRDPFNPAAPPRSADVGLVGLHVILRTPKRRQWIWSSFEHVDNVPGPEQPAAPGRTFSFNYGTAYTGSPAPNVDANPPAGATPGIPQASQSLGPEGPGGPRPTQVARLQDLHPVTQQVNERYRQALAAANSVWQNYRLVVTQFPSNPGDINADYDGDPFPAPVGEAEGGRLVSVANATMETYVQKNTSCMACHQGAKSYGVAFVFSLGRALDRTPPPQEVAAARMIVAARHIAPSPAPGGGALRHRVRVERTDRDVLGPLIQRLTPNLPAPRPAAPLQAAASLQAAAAVPAGMLVYERDVRPIFLQAVQRWTSRNLCPPDIALKHGQAFGWANNQPWATWPDLQRARFAPPGTDPAQAPLLVDGSMAKVRDMLLVRALRGPGVAEAKNQQMPLNGPYLTADEIATLERFLSQQFNKPIE